MIKPMKIAIVCAALIGCGLVLSGCSGSDDLKPEKPDPTLDSLPAAPNEGPPGSGGGSTAPPGPKKGPK